MMERYLSVRELAQRLSVSPSTVWAWAKGGRLPRPVKLGANTTRWRASEVEAAIERMQEAA